MSTTGFYVRAARHAGLRFVDLDASADPVDREAAAAVSAWLAREYDLLPLAFEESEIVVAVAAPAATEGILAVEAMTGLRARLVVATPDAIRRGQERVYGMVSESPAVPVASQLSPAEDRLRAANVALLAGCELVSLEPADGVDPVNHSAAQLFSEELCRRLAILPISIQDGVVTVAAAEAPEQLALRVAEVLARSRPRVVIASRHELERAIERVFAQPRVERERTVDVTPADRLGELLLATNLITPEQLYDALRIQERTGGRIGEVLVHAGLASEDNVAAALAEQLRFPLVDLSTITPDPGALALVPEILARRNRFVPIAIHDHVLYLAMSDPLDDAALEQLRLHTRLPIRTLISSRRAVEQLLERTYADRYVRVATAELLNRSPEESAYRVITRPQAAVLIVTVTVFILFLARDPIATLIVFNGLTTLFYTSFSLYKFKLIYDALGHQFELPVSDEEIAALDERDLPVITIIVPLYREAAVVSKLVESVARLDYPRQKLDVKLVTEEDDVETRNALEALELAPHFKVLVIPDAQPKTKPKACNYALIQAEGKYVVIYDAEDRPEPDQLKKVMVAFGKADERIACIQCKLNYYNRDQNLLTRWFTIEYSGWFDLFMPGLDAADSPIPLGGTSNFLDREKLIELGAWDPFNVTEDADLGIRLHRAGYKTAIVDSTTFEEANSDLYNWIRQRSRWVKGYIQTWLVHMRHPILLHRQIGWRSWWSFQFVVAGTFVGFLLNPVYWLLTTLWIVSHAGFIRDLFPSFIYFSAAFGLFIGNFVFTYVNVAGTMRRGYPELVKYALLSPLYWTLMSIGAWKGFLQLFYRPFYWEKTVHGLDDEAIDG